MSAPDPSPRRPRTSTEPWSRSPAERGADVDSSRYRSVIEAMPVGWAAHRVIVDRIGRPIDITITDVNPAFERLTGWAKEEVIGRSVGELLARVPGFDPACISTLGRVAVTGVPRELALAIGPGGRMVRVSAQPAGPLRVDAIYRDTRPDDPIPAASRAVESRLQALFDEAGYGLCRASPDGPLLEVSNGLAEMLGYESAKLLQLDARTELWRVAEEYDRLHGRLAQGAAEVEVETDWARADGSSVRVKIRGRATTSARGVCVHELFVEDLSERRELESQLRHAQKMEVVGELTGGIAHDFNNLITTILIAATLLKETDVADSATRTELLDGIEAAALSASALTSRLLGFSRKANLIFEPLDLGQATLSAAQLLDRVLPESIEIVTRVADALPLVQADATAVEQIVLNLANNARDAMPEGGVLTLEVQAVTLDEAPPAFALDAGAGDYVCLVLRDTGKGMDDATRARVFEPFFTTKPAESGTGLGMAMVHSLMQQLGGGVHIASEPGLGTTVRLYFPALSEGERSIGAGPAVVGGEEVILLVEGQPPVRRLAHRVLEGAGYEVIATDNGADAVRLFEAGEDRIGLVVADVVVPGMGGEALLEALRGRRLDLPCVLTSGDGRWYDREPEDRDALPYTTLAKPWTSEQLLGTVRQALDRAAR